jgi:hypothetical protein
LKEIVERKGLTDRDEPSALPTGQLSGRDMKDPKYVRSIEVVHSPQAPLTHGLLSSMWSTCKYKVDGCAV